MCYACSLACRPWVERNSFDILLVFALRLHEEILDFADYMSPRQEEHAMRKEVVERIRNVVTRKWPGAKVNMKMSF